MLHLRECLQSLVSFDRFRIPFLVVGHSLYLALRGTPPFRLSSFVELRSGYWHPCVDPKVVVYRG